MKKLILFFLVISTCISIAQPYKINIKELDGDWTSGPLMNDDGVDGDVTAGDGIHSIIRNVNGVPQNSKLNWYVKDTAIDGEPTITTSWSYIPVAQNVLFTYDVNTYNDGWLPSTMIPNSHEALEMVLDGDGNPTDKIVTTIKISSVFGEVNNEFIDDGNIDYMGDVVANDGIWSYKHNIASAGNHDWYVWHHYVDGMRWETKGKYNSYDGTLTKENVPFTTTEDNQDVFFYLDVNTSRVYTSVGVPLPVELTTFTANVVKNNVELNWETATEVNNYGFNIERASSPLSMTSSQDWKELGFIEGHGNSNSPKYYSYSDKLDTDAGTYFYRLKQIDIDGQFEYSDVVEVTLGTPNSFELSQNYPNPFNPTTSIKFSITEASKVKLSVYNVVGELVTELINKNMEAGYHKVNFDASKLNSGVYLYKIEAGNFSEIKRMMLIK